MSRYSRYITFAKKNVPLLIVSLIPNILAGLSKSVGATYLQRITDALEAGVSDGILAYVLIGGTLTFGTYVLMWVGKVAPDYFSRKFSCETRVELFTHLSKIPFIKYEGYTQGQLQSIIQNDIERAGEIFYIAISRILNNIFLFIFSVWVMALTSVSATIVAVIIVIAATAINQRILSRQKKHDVAAQGSLGDMTHSLESTFSGIETVKTYRANKFVAGKFLGHLYEYCKHRLGAVRVNAIRNVWIAFTEHLVLYGSVAYLGFLGIRGEMSIGQVLMFIYLIKQIIMPVAVVFGWMSSLVSAGASLDRANHVFSEAQEQTTQPNANHGGADSIEAKNITFAYGEDNPIIESFCISLKSGQITGLAGASGSGKTTLLKILTGVYDSTGRYTVDGVETVTLSGLSAYASLDKSLFPMTIYENITLGNPNISRTNVKAVFERLGFAEWINSLSDGIDTFVNDDISGGQKQTISTARALLSGKPFIILDEPYSALDVGNGQALTDVLQDEMQSRIILLTSHREDAFAGAGQIVTLG